MFALTLGAHSFVVKKNLPIVKQETGFSLLQSAAMAHTCKPDKRQDENSHQKRDGQITVGKYFNFKAVTAIFKEGQRAIFTLINLRKRVPR
jgi:hypothetical protein